MRDWISKLDDFLKLTERDILTHAGNISHNDALDKAYAEYDKYHKASLNAPSKADIDFLDAEKEIKQIESASKRRRKNG